MNTQHRIERDSNNEYGELITIFDTHISEEGTEWEYVEEDKLIVIYIQNRIKGKDALVQALEELALSTMSVVNHGYSMEGDNIRVDNYGYARSDNTQPFTKLAIELIEEQMTINKGE